MNLIYVSDKMVEYMIKNYPDLNENDVYEIIESSEVYNQEIWEYEYKPSFTHDIYTSIRIKIPFSVCSKFKITNDLPFLDDDNGIFLKRKVI